MIPLKSPQIATLSFGKFSSTAKALNGRVNSEKSIKKIKLSDVQNYYNNNYSPSVSSLVIVGDIDRNTLLSKIDFLKKWQSKNVNIPTNFEYPKNNETQIYLLDKEGASQSFIIMGHIADKYDVDGDFFKSQIKIFIIVIS